MVAIGFHLDSVEVILVHGHRSVTVTRLLKLDSFGIVWTLKRRKLLIYIDSNEIHDAASYGKSSPFIDYEPRGRGFDSCQPHQKNKRQINGLAPKGLTRFFCGGNFSALFPALPQCRCVPVVWRSACASRLPCMRSRCHAVLFSQHPYRRLQLKPAKRTRQRSWSPSNGWSTTTSRCVSRAPAARKSCGSARPCCQWGRAQTCGKRRRGSCRRRRATAR